MTSYKLQVHVVDGEPHLESYEGVLPEGRITVSGHDVSPSSRSITVLHTDHEGGHVVSAGATHAK